MEGSNRGHPTLPYILLASSSLRDHCLPNGEDGPHLQILKERCARFLEAKFQPSIKAKVATFLWPDFKERLFMLTEEEREEVNFTIFYANASLFCPTRYETITVTTMQRIKRFFFQVHARVRALISEPAGEADDLADKQPPPAQVLRLEDKYGRYRRPQPVMQDEVSRYVAMVSPPIPADQLFQYWKMLVCTVQILKTNRSPHYKTCFMCNFYFYRIDQVGCPIWPSWHSGSWPSWLLPPPARGSGQRRRLHFKYPTKSAVTQEFAGLYFFGLLSASNGIY